MLLKSLTRVRCSCCLRPVLKTSSIRKYSVIPDPKVIEEVSNDVYKPKKHPGRMDNSVVVLPSDFVKSAFNVAEDFPIKALIQAGEKLSHYLNARVPAMEDQELKLTITKIQEELLKKNAAVVINSEEDARKFENSINNKANFILSQKVYNWRPIKYDTHTSLVYLLGRSAAEYAALYRILGEIAQRDKEFIPRSLFDFGSGVGTVTWAANQFWKNHIFEYYNVDSSANMNDLAQIMLQGGRGNGKSIIKGNFYRQFLPSSNTEYDLVTSAYTLMELPTLESRLATVLNLWNKTSKYLVIVEQGTNAGFKVVNEVRDFILQIDKPGSKGHVFSPCPHDAICPRYTANDGTPCNFEVRYHPISIGKQSEPLHEKYSYVVLQKGERVEGADWPRIVRPPLVRPRHTICRICTAGGKLDEVIFTSKKHGKMAYHCARSSKWGDFLPVKVESDELIDADDSSEDGENHK